MCIRMPIFENNNFKNTKLQSVILLQDLKFDSPVYGNGMEIDACGPSFD